MSSMSSQPPKPPPRPYSPYSATPSPANSTPFAPPAKRQRLSPSAPNGLPSYAPPQTVSHGLTSVGAYGNPYAASPPPAQSPYSPTPYGAASSPQSAFNSPQPYQPPHQQQHVAWQPQPNLPPSSQMMPPPPRPNKEDREDRAGVDEIGDSLFGSGINLKDEENYLHNAFHNRHAAPDTGFSANQSGSFGSSTLSPNNSFGLLTQATSFPSSTGPDGAFAGTLGPTHSQEQIDVEARRRRQQAALDRARQRQHHQSNPYLQGTPVYNRLHRRARDNGVRVPTQGLYQQAPLPEPRAQVSVSADGSQGLVRAQHLLDANVELEQILTLLSLAAGERIGGLVDEALALARARRYGDHGRVPPEFADITVGEGGEQGVEEVVLPENITGSQWDGSKEDESTAATAQRTVAFPSRVSATLRDLAARDRQAEQDRAAKREVRRRAAAANGGDDATAPDQILAGADLTASIKAGTPLEAVAPMAAAAAKITKKEAERAKKEAAKNVEANSHTTTNQTAAMMALGKKGRRYEWMTGGVGSMPTNRFKAPGGGEGGGPGTTMSGKTDGRPGTPGGTAGVGAGVGLGGGVSGIVGERGVEWGDWREDGVGGTGIQLRDWAAVLERDGREKLALQRAWHRMG